MSKKDTAKEAALKVEPVVNAPQAFPDDPQPAAGNTASTPDEFVWARVLKPVHINDRDCLPERLDKFAGIIPPDRVKVHPLTLRDLARQGLLQSEDDYRKEQRAKQQATEAKAEADARADADASEQARTGGNTR